MSPQIAGAEKGMFTTFQGLSQPRQEHQEAPKPATNNTAKRITTPHACAECKRRKIRCDGRQPCGQCVGCRSPKPCYYDKHRQRVIPSRKTLDALTQSLEECRNVLRRLYPNRDPNTLLNLSREELISILDRSGSIVAGSQTSPIGSNTSPQSNEFHSPVTASEDNQSLADLEQIPSQDVEWDEERRNRDPIPVESDDVNALSLSVERQTSYLGATSIKAAFLVMLKVAPVLRSFLAPTPSREAKHNNAPLSNYPTPRPGFKNSTKSLLAISWSSEGQTLIDAYFKRVQIFIPMLDEPSFRADYLSGRRHDAPWLALVNMVFTMGSIVASKSDDHQHVNYYNKAKEHLQIDSFGSGHIETLQALALMGGFYLHYINRPNMANAICGAALRIACAMGLHRETPAEPGQSTLLVEQRRRTWWSLFCLDTWAQTTLGRPSMGRWGQAITVRPPDGPIDPNVMGDNINIIPLIENIKFCHIATKIQDALAHSPVLRTEERDHLDAQLCQWYENLHVSLRSTEACNENIYTARCVMKWRYQNLRIVLFRPVLLNLANKSVQGNPPSPDDLAAVTKLRAISKQTIEDIANECGPNQMLGWNGVWFLYQASMIPLVSIFWERWNTQQVQECQHQIEIVLNAMQGMLDWSLAARRSREVLVKMYEASKRPITRQTSPRLGPMTVNNGATPGMMMPASNGEMMEQHQQMLQQHLYQPYHILDENGMIMQNIDTGDNWALNEMLWGATLPDGYDAPYDGMPFETGYEGVDLQQQQQQQQQQQNGMMYKYEGDGNAGAGGYMMQH